MNKTEAFAKDIIAPNTKITVEKALTVVSPLVSPICLKNLKTCK